jgi:hypothetical protein
MICSQESVILAVFCDKAITAHCAAIWSAVLRLSKLIWHLKVSQNSMAYQLFFSILNLENARIFVLHARVVEVPYLCWTAPPPFSRMPRDRALGV